MTSASGAVASQRKPVDVGALDEFPVGKMKLVQAGRLEIGILRWHDGSVYALHNRCPHAGGPICTGRIGAAAARVRPLLWWDEGAESGGPEVADDVPIVVCAWHQYQFDVRTGELICDPSLRARTFPVDVDEGRVVVQLYGRNRRAPAA